MCSVSILISVPNHPSQKIVFKTFLLSLPRKPAQAAASPASAQSAVGFVQAAAGLSGAPPAAQRESEPGAAAGKQAPCPGELTGSQKPRAAG